MATPPVPTGPGGGALGSPPQKTVKDLTADEVSKRLRSYVTQERRGLLRFYKGDLEKSLGIHIDNGVAMAKRLMHLKNSPCKRETALSLSILTLFDLVMLLDNSISMADEANAPRIKTLEDTLTAVAAVYTPASGGAGITAVELLNQGDCFEEVKAAQVKELMSNIRYDGLTPIGRQLKKKVLEKYAKVSMEKPLLVIVITDGEVEGEPDGLLRNVIVEKALELEELHDEFGAQAVAYQFAKVGDDEEAAKLLKGLDTDKKLGTYIDCVVEDGYELESIGDGHKRWEILLKLLLGAITAFWDDTLGVQQADVMPDDKKLSDPRAPKPAQLAPGGPEPDEWN